MTEFPKFARRSNLDGTIDSKCLRCIATVAITYRESELPRYEGQHVCDPVVIERFFGRKPPSSETVEDSQNREFTKAGRAMSWLANLLRG